MVSISELNSVKVYLVGGAVRDEIMGVKSKDLDFAVEAPSFEVMHEWIRVRGQIFQVKPEFQTIRARMTGFGVVDFVLCRKEGAYRDGRHPDTVEIGTLHDDLARRDFTMNAIARLPDNKGSFIDPFNGIADIEARKIKCVGSARVRLSEDTLRILRAIRFSITKNFSLDEEILTCLQDAALVAGLDAVSADRKREEINKCLGHNTLETLKLLERFSHVRDHLFSGNIRLEATQRQ